MTGLLTPLVSTHLAGFASVVFRIRLFRLRSLSGRRLNSLSGGWLVVIKGLKRFLAFTLGFILLNL